MIDPLTREAYRARWHRARERLILLNIQQEAFATGGVGQYVPQLAVRLVILPGDPDSKRIEFNDEFWSWLESEHENPLHGRVNIWGHTVIPTTSVAVVCQQVSDGPWKWGSYLALYRHGGLDMGLGHGGGKSMGQKRLFRLVHIVGRLWSALHFYGHAVSHFHIDGPWECSVALLQTQGGSLANFGAGWAQYGEPYANPTPCPEPNLWLRREFDEWPQPDDIRDLAFNIGGWIEDSWGMRCRRFLARNGPLAGQFDTSCYRSF
ncbi:MAG: hypothetical protein A3C36_00365 [Omnitrophica WOR_2 bacterium RIFCSPHIGHO2_02_FULL_52_10]|nr:MAG: hypothetical protein A3C36_00365 [Omnitrophica WOR_2 bacterium RIFCSPHIGHO2_02_FULL_52_10]